MFKVRKNDIADFEHYLQVRKGTPTLATRRTMLLFTKLVIGAGGGFALFVAAILALFSAPIIATGIFIAIFVASMVFLKRQPKQILLSPDEEFFERANEAAQQLTALLHGRRLRGSLHAGMAILMNECASSWRRIEGVNQSRVWKSPARAQYWTASQRDWTRASDVAMSEALILASNSITLAAPVSPAKAVISEILNQFDMPGVSMSEPLPYQFGELREIADKLQLLATEVESIARTLEHEPDVEATPHGTKTLEDVLSNLKAIRSAETETRRSP